MSIKPIQVKNIKRLLIRSTNWIGDAVMTTPAIRSIRQNFGHAQISLLAKPWVIPVFENSEHVDRIITYEAAGRHKGNVGKLRLAKDLRKYDFDAAILLQNAFEAALIAFLAGIPIRIGYNTDARTVLLTHPVVCGPEVKKRHQTRYYLNILKGVGLKDGQQSPYVAVNDRQRSQARKMLNDHGVCAGERLVGINPSATYGPAKQWPLQRYALLADKIQSLTDCRILVFGGPEDREIGRRISEMVKRTPLVFAGKTTLSEAIALIEQCALFITNDSGLMHVAAALNVPLVAIFGSTNPTTTGPFSPLSRIVQFPVACNPCLKPECPDGHLKCMDRIDVDMVFDVVKELL